MATYSSAPAQEIVTFQHSVQSVVTGNQPFNKTLVTVQENERYQPLYFYFSGDSGGVNITLKGTLISNFISGISGLSLNDNGNLDVGHIGLVHEAFFGGSGGRASNGGVYRFLTYVFDGIDGSGQAPNSQTQVVRYGKITQNVVYEADTVIKIDGQIHDYNVSGEHAAIRIAFLKTTFFGL